ncbi:hypothetical protein FB45DRAFT_1052734 [Roridomyces roridus]|uniref:Uncharacterized protein n=1 Tax=Roridomyces roridus TaxID=1738132 RepID=A0AAD7CAN2_9AGAR|nr:hypothetical protein FB45DRAFT_1052734 [Roridomyces roridus]
MSSTANNNTNTLSQEPAPPRDGALLHEQPAAPAAGNPPVVPFKDRVIGVAKKTRGTLLAKPELKEHGEKILQGEASIHDDPSQL